MAMTKTDGPRLLVGWTTVETPEQADRLADGLVRSRLAACVQIDAPVTSHYVWKGKAEADREIRIWTKFPEDRAEALETWLHQNHPYETPQWLAVPAERVHPDYLAWAIEQTRP
ncbi:MAG: divalent-cation tolerance protein CutA [Opitutales bacterium]